MGKEIILSNTGFFLGIVGIILAVVPFLSSRSVQLYNIILPLLLGITGLILVFKVKKELKDDLVKAGLFVNPLAILLGTIQLVIYIIQ